MRISRILLSSALLVASLAAHSYAAIPQSEHDALVTLFNAMGGANWNRNEGWLGAAGTECSWRGVECDSGNTTVLGIELDYNNVSGSISPAIASLHNLQTLNLTSNSISGTIPSFLPQLSALRVLRLAGNNLTGGIPKELGSIKTLRVLSLSANPLGGTIPVELSTIPLEELQIGDDALTGTIPAAFFQMGSLTRLEAYANRLTGTIPATLALPNLTNLDLGNNDLSGTLPAALGTSANLQFLYLSDNDFEGSIPTTFGQLKKLERLDLASNKLTGNLPQEIGGMTALTLLNLHANPLSGTIPSAIGQLQNLEFLALSYSNMGGPLPPEFYTLKKLRDLHIEHNGYNTSETARFTGNLADFAAMTELRVLHLATNDFPGPIPVALTTLPNLETLQLDDNLIGGTIPPEIANLKTLKEFTIADAALSGAMPESISTMPQLAVFFFERNRLTSLPQSIGQLPELVAIRGDANLFSGPLPESLGSAAKLRYVQFRDNQFSGNIPAGLFALTALEYIDFAGNRLTGSLPSFARLTALRGVDLSSNQLSGNLPDDIGASTLLEDMQLRDNLFSGPVPVSLQTSTSLRRLNLNSNDLDSALPDFSAWTNLDSLDLGRNRLSGTIPPSVGKAANLTYLDIGNNKLSGQIPAEIANLTKLQYLILDKNALYNTNPAIASFLGTKAGLWDTIQTVAPSNAAINAARERSLTVSWTPIAYTGDPGGYGIYVATAPGGPFNLLVTTPDKSVATFSIDGLDPSTDYYVRVNSITYPNSSNKNTVISEPTPTLKGRTGNGTPNPPSVALLTLTDGMYQNANSSGAADRYVLTNLGDIATQITVSQEGSFFTQSPTTFTLNGGESQRIQITALASPEGAYSGFSIPSGTGVPAGLKIPVRLLSTPPVTGGTVVATPSTNRIDVSAAVDATSVGGSVNFTNSGTARLVGIVVADVAWIIPPTDRVIIEPGQTVTVAFTIDRSKRPPDATVGAAVGTLSLIYSTASAGARASDNPPQPGLSLVTVIDTVAPPTANTGFDSVPPGVVPLFIPGVGHLQGSVGLFLSDLSIINAYGVSSLNDIKIYYNPATGFAQATKVTSIGGVQPAQSIALADVVKGVFDDQQQGTLQIRSRDWASLALNANIFNVTNQRGTYGSSIPVFRADRALTGGNSLYLAGVKKGTGFHTNILLQETAGAPADADVTFFDAEGNAVTPAQGNVSANVPPYQLTRLLDVVPPNAVLARITNRSGSAGRLVAYATPIDDASGDFWTVADWNQISASQQSEPQVVPVAGSVHGANDNFFRTDLTVSNRAADTNEVRLDFYYAGNVLARTTLTLAARETRVIDDVIGSLFPTLTNQVGYIIATPTREMTITSRTFATQTDVAGTFGTGVPSLPFSAALHAGQSHFIAGLQVSALKTIGEKKPATFRTNLGLAEISGSSATVRVRVVYSDLKQGSVASRLLTREFALAPHQFSLISLSTLIADSNAFVDDLRNVRVDVTVVSGEGAVIAFTASTDNGTADQILRTE